MTDWTRHIRDIPDFPKPGIVFKDIMPMLADAQAFAAAITALATPWRQMPLDAVVCIEARGFLLGAPLARELGCGVVPLRKPGKLPGTTIEVQYALEYGHDALQAQAAAGDGAWGQAEDVAQVSRRVGTNGGDDHASTGPLGTTSVWPRKASVGPSPCVAHRLSTSP